jgi:hypothetical protein
MRSTLFPFASDFWQKKARLRWPPAGWYFFRSLWPCLAQAMAVRRHGGPVMMVVTVMAVALHLSKT